MPILSKLFHDKRLQKNNITTVSSISKDANARHDESEENEAKREKVEHNDDEMKEEEEEGGKEEEEKKKKKKKKKLKEKLKSKIGNRFNKLKQNAKSKARSRFSALKRLRGPNFRQFRTRVGLKSNLEGLHERLQERRERFLLDENQAPTWWLVFFTHWLFFVTNFALLGLGIATVIFSSQAFGFERMLNKLDPQQTATSGGIITQLTLGIGLVVLAGLGYLCFWGNEGAGLVAHGLTTTVLTLFTLAYSLLGFLDRYLAYFPGRLAQSLPVAFGKLNQSKQAAIRVQMFQAFAQCCGFDTIAIAAGENRILASCCGRTVVPANSTATCPFEDLLYPTLCIDTGSPGYVTVVSHLNYYITWVAVLATCASCHIASTYNRPISLGIPSSETPVSS